MSIVMPTNARTLRLHPTAVIGLRVAGPVLPRVGEEGELALDLADLELLLAAARGEVDAAPAGRDELIAALVARRWLQEHDQHHVAVTDLTAAVEVLPEALGDELAGGDWVLPVPLLLNVGPRGFEHVDHEGRIAIQLRADEAMAATALANPAKLEAAYQIVAERTDGQLTEEAFDDLVRRLITVGLVVPFDPSHPVHASRGRQAEAMREGMRRQFRVHAEFDRLDAEHDAVTEPGKVKVIGHHRSWAGMPASLAMIIAAAKAYDGGVLARDYDFRPRLLWDQERLDQVADEGPAIFLYSNYIWSTAGNLEQSARVKASHPHHVTVHGGPDTPKYLVDAERFFAVNPHVDVAVHGEGEATFPAMLDALRGAVGDGPPDLSVLGDVPGLSFRHGDGIVQTADRERIADLDAIPSPVLTGVYDGFIPAGSMGAIIMETNRGCPYGCTFCDWGSATLSRVRKFDLDRIFAELEWSAKHQIETVGIADANFGIFERDVEIAEKIAQLKAEYGYPRFVGNNYAKNTVKHLSKIIEIFTDAGIVAEGKMSMQTFDPGTLATIRRKNIKVEKYYDLSGEFRRNKLPMMVDIMMGLPGSSPETFAADLQECISRSVRVAIHTTMLLTNSPMNEPEYRAEHGITAQPGEEVKETTTYTRADWDMMRRLTDAYYVLENFGVLRQVATYVHGETGMREIDVYDRIVRAIDEQTGRWPMLEMTLGVLPEMMVPPVSWALLLAEVRTFVVEELGVPDDDALDTVLRVQHALLPARDREFPLTLSLPHDYVAWHSRVVELRDQGHRHDWHEDLELLREFGPGTFTVDDPFDVCTTALGGSLRSLMVENSWDLDSPVSRPRQRLAEDEPLSA